MGCENYQCLSKREFTKGLNLTAKYFEIDEYKQERKTFIRSEAVTIS